MQAEMITVTIKMLTLLELKDRFEVLIWNIEVIQNHIYFFEANLST
jgi:hypothetical protein